VLCLDAFSGTGRPTNVPRTSGFRRPYFRVELSLLKAIPPIAMLPLTTQVFPVRHRGNMLGVLRLNLWRGRHRGSKINVPPAPTVKLDPSGRAPLHVAISVPDSTTVHRCRYYLCH